MSRIGKQPIRLPEGVVVKVAGSEVAVIGPRGKAEFTLPHQVRVALPAQVGRQDEVMQVTVQSPDRDRALWGLWRSLLDNAVVGVSEGFTRELELVGLGYRVKKEGEDLVLSLGWSHPVPFPAPEGVSFEIEGDTKIKVTGIDKQLVHVTAARIRALKKPEPYKGKGIRYRGEVVRRKAGKAGKVEGFGGGK